jgi:hypothetical protein
MARGFRFWAFILLTSCTAASDPVDGAREAFGGWILASRPGAVSMDVWALPASGGSAIQITRTSSVDELDPAWSPMGDRIAFARRAGSSSSSDIWVVARDGTGAARLTDGGADDRQPEWSPDGRWIVWIRGLDVVSLSELWVMRADGSEARPLVRSVPGTYLTSPVWSPVGDQIAFVRERPGRLADIVVVRADGRKLRRLTTDDAAETSPAWYPTGDRIVFERITGKGHGNLWSIAANGSRLVRLTSGWDREASPSFSPDGSRLAYIELGPRTGSQVRIVRLSGRDSGGSLSSVGGEISLDWGPGSRKPRIPSTRDQRSGPRPAGISIPVIAEAGSGVALRRMRFRETNVFVLGVEPAARARIDVALAGPEVSYRAKTSLIAARHGAIAAVNGDFALASGRPLHPFAEDGELKNTSEVGSHNFAVSVDEKIAYLGRPIEDLIVKEAHGGASWRFDQLNAGAPGANEVAAYTPAGSQHGEAPSHVCSALLEEAGPRQWADGRSGVIQPHRVVRARCGIRPIQGEGLVLSARFSSAESLLVSSLTPGEGVVATWSLGWPAVADSIGGLPLLVDRGRVRDFRCDPFLCQPPHPRTGVGITSYGRLLLVVADGRQDDSRGLDLNEFARLFVRLGAQSALNLDGGASSTMVLDGQVINEPSYGYERRVSSALLVLKGPDPQERLARSS